MRTFFIAILIGKDTATVLLHVIVFLSCEFLPFVKERAKILIVKSWRGGFAIELLSVGNNGFVVLVFAIQEGGAEIGYLVLQGHVPTFAESDLVAGVTAGWRAGIAQFKDGA